MSTSDPPPASKPLCFVIMPFRTKPDPAGGPPIDFDAIYEQALKPAIEDAGLEPVRGDQERLGGIIHRAMFERLLLCEYAIADLTTANANVFYELGVRHAVRPATTLAIFAAKQQIPFDVSFVRALPYTLNDDNSLGPERAEALRKDLRDRIAQLRDVTHDDDAIDSPLFQLISAWRPAPIARDKTDVFREQVRQDEARKQRLTEIRRLARQTATKSEADAKLAKFVKSLGSLDAISSGTLLDVMLTYRALEDWTGMIEFGSSLPQALRRQVLVREQLAFAYNRKAKDQPSDPDRDYALRLLEAVEQEQGASSETCGLIGRVYKDLWAIHTQLGSVREAKSCLVMAIEAYRRGYLADPRDTYPGINLLTLLDIHGEPASKAEAERLLPVVRFAVERRMRGKTPDYWDHATAIELAVLNHEPEAAKQSLGNALRTLRERWEAKTTANNLRLIAQARASRGEPTAWLEEILAALEKD